MLRKLFRSGIIGILATEFVVILYFTVHSLIIKSNNFIMVSPSFMDKVDLPQLAFFYQFLLVAVSGMIFGISINIFKIDLFPRIMQFFCHFFITFTTWYILSLLCCWITFSLINFFLSTLIFFLIYLLVYFVLLIIEKVEISQTNKKISTIKEKKLNNNK